MLVVWGGVQWQQGAGLETEKARNAGGYGELSYSDAAHITTLHLYESLLHVLQT